MQWVAVLRYLKSKSKWSVSSKRSELKTNLSLFKAFNPRPERTNALPIDSETNSRRSALEAIAKLMPTIKFFAKRFNTNSINDGVSQSASDIMHHGLKLITTLNTVRIWWVSCGNPFFWISLIRLSNFSNCSEVNLVELTRCRLITAIGLWLSPTLKLLFTFRYKFSHF